VNSLIELDEIEGFDVDSPEKCHSFTVSIIECDRFGWKQANLFGQAGFRVIAVNTNPHNLRMIEKRQKTETAKKNGMDLSSTSDVREAARKSQIIVITIKSPIEKRRPDYSTIERVCQDVGMGLKRKSLILFMSTTGPGVVEGRLREKIEKASGLIAGEGFGLAYSTPSMHTGAYPEEPSRTPRVVAAIDSSSLKIAAIIIERISRSPPIKVRNIKTAEVINLISVAKSEADLAFANELALVCEKLGVDFIEVAEAVENDRTLSIPFPNLVGSSWKDFYHLSEESENAGSELRLLRHIKKANDETVDRVLRVLRDTLKTCKKTLRRSKISILGVSGQTDLKTPPHEKTSEIIELLRKKVRTINVYDPYFSQTELNKLGYNAEKFWKAVEGTDCIIIFTRHSRFRRLNLKRIKLLARRNPAIIDFARVIDQGLAEKRGFIYYGVGRGIVAP
jgi:UDP-N-acetyl-D-mannosaminuronic acid dehydrogenase